jgi:hypothetical protein
MNVPTGLNLAYRGALEMKHTLAAWTLPFAALMIALAFSSGSSTAESAQATPLPPVENPDGRAGVCFSYYPGDPGRPYLPLVHNAGSRWDRFDFIWPNIERTENSWYFDGYDDLVDDMSDAGMQVVGILLWTPDWAATGRRAEKPLSRPGARPSDWYAPSLLAPQAPSSLSPSPPRGLYEAWDDWTTSDGDPINYWGRYVHTVVSRYSDPARFERPVRHWEVWNEVDDGAWNYFWTGSEADYAQLLKVGYQATKNACPDCTILCAGLLYWADQQYFERVLDILNNDPSAPANNYYFDVMSVHLYSRTSTIYDTVRLIRSRMKAHVPDHPIWLTETGVMVWDDGSVDPDPTKYDFAATQEEAAAYVIQSYANAWASRVERYFFFRANDQDMFEYFGLMRNDQSFRPSYVAYQVATTYLVTPTMVTNWTYDDGTRRVTLWGTPRGKVSVLWNTRPNAHIFDYPAILDIATRVDRWGAAEPIAATGGVYPLDLAGATANRMPPNENDYIIGGEPYLIIEEDTIPPTTATVRPLPVTTYSHTIQVSWEATDAEAGIWGFDVQVSREGGGWTDWLGLGDTVGKASALYVEGEDNETYCFRARAWDRAGNLGAWSDVERCTTLSLSRRVHVSVGTVFGDENSSGGQPEEGEPILADVSFRFVDEQGQDVMTPTIGSSWAFTITLDVGDYALLITPPGWPSLPPGWLPRRLPVSLETGGASLLEVDFPVVGLPPHRTSSFLPLLARSR